MDPQPNHTVIRPTKRPPGLERAPGWLIRHRRSLIVTAHSVAFVLSLLLSFLVTNFMRFSAAWFLGQFPYWLGVALAIKLTVYGLFGQYRGWWRYVGIADLFSIFHASFTSTLILFVLWGAAAAEE